MTKTDDERTRVHRAPVSRLTGFEYGVLEQPDSCLWTADQHAMQKAAKRLRWLEAERTRAHKEVPHDQD